MDVCKSWCVSSISVHRTCHELGWGRGLLSDGVWSSGHRLSSSVCETDFKYALQMILQNIWGSIWSLKTFPEQSGLAFINPNHKHSLHGRKWRTIFRKIFLQIFLFNSNHQFSNKNVHFLIFQKQYLHTHLCSFRFRQIHHWKKFIHALISNISEILERNKGF